MEIAINALLDPAPYNLVRQLQTEIAQHFPTEATLKLEPHITVKYAFPISDLSDVTNYFTSLPKAHRLYHLQLLVSKLFQQM